MERTTTVKQWIVFLASPRKPGATVQEHKNGRMARLVRKVSNLSTAVGEQASRIGFQIREHHRGPLTLYQGASKLKIDVQRGEFIPNFSHWRIASITSNDALILPHGSNLHG